MLTSLDGARILLLEDHASFRDDLQAILESEGYQVKACGSGLEALELASQHTFELVISDVRMAGMDGLEAIERLQQHYDHLATLVITGYTADTDSIRAVRLGVGDYLKKPFDLVDFLAVVARLLRNHREQQLRRQTEQNLRKAAAWALQRLYCSLHPDCPPPDQPRQAQAVAREMGLPPETAWQSMAVTWLQLCQPQPSAELPDDLKRLLQELQDAPASEDPPSLPALIAQLSLSGQLDASLPDALRDAYSRVSQRPLPPAPPDPQRHLRLRQAQTQEGSEPAAARQGYEAVLQGGQSDVSALEATLGLARLSQANPTECQKWGEQAVQISRGLNGLLTASSCFEVGLLFQRNGWADKARLLFEQTGRLARELALPGWEARATLALHLAGANLARALLERALTHLTQVGQRIDLLSCSDWLAPGLLRWHMQQPDPLLERALTLIGRDAPGSFLKANLDNPARLAMLHYLPGPSLKTLENDAAPEVRQAVQVRLGSRPPEPTTPLLRIYALGTFEVYRGEERLLGQGLKSPKQRFMLCRLALAGRPLNSDVLIEEFWPDSLDAGRSSLSMCATNLRKLLRSGDGAPELDAIRRDTTGVYIHPDLPVWFDARELLQVLEANPAPDDADWKKAIQLYRGPFLEDCYMDWAVSLRQTFEIRITQCLGEWLAGLASAERAAETLDYAQRLLQLDNCSQEAYLACMRAHLWQGRPEWALRTYETCQKTLQRELGAEPSLAILEVYQRARLSLA